MNTRWNPMLRDIDLDNWEFTPKSSCQVAFTGRMGAGSAGEITRSHPVSVVQRVNDASTPATIFGEAVLYTTSGNSIRTTAQADTNDVSPGVVIAGVTVRPFPTQAATAPQNFGGTGTQQTPFGDLGSLAASTVVDIVEDGFVLVKVNGAPVLGGAVYVYCDTTTGVHTHGTFEVATQTTHSFLVANALWASPADANGFAELRVMAQAIA